MIAQYLERSRAAVDRTLNRLLPPERKRPAVIHRAMRYSVFAGGKRLRPALVLAAAEACRPAGVARLRTALLEAAAGMEMLHTYSLIHDDLPAMDDDDLRRGKPTSHRRFGEGNAILAGDALLTAAFQVFSGLRRVPALRARAAEVVSEVADAAGTLGLIGGQAADLQMAGNGRVRGRERARLLRYIHLNKTAAMITTSLRVGGVIVGASPAQMRRLSRYGRAVGLAFQIMDDVLDVVGDRAKMGKRGSDRDNHKLTYPAVHGVESSRSQARALARAAQAAVKPFGVRAKTLSALADYIIERDH